MHSHARRRGALAATLALAAGLGVFSGTGRAVADTTSTTASSPSATLPPPLSLSGLPSVTPDCATLMAHPTGGSPSYATCVASVTLQSPVPLDPAAVPATPKPAVAITSPYPSPQLECVDLTTGEWWYEREWFCIIDQGVIINTIDTSNGSVIGQATYTVTHAGGLDPQGGTWTNFTALYLSAQWGNYASIVSDSNACSPCSGIQSGSPWPGTQTAVPGVAVTGSDNLSDGPLPGSIDNGINVIWNDTFECPGCVTSATVNYTFSNLVRCDAQANTGSAVGCAIGSWVPELVLTGYSTGNTSTAFVSWFQSNNTDHWGQYPNGAPLTRLNNPTQRDANRAAMCSGFVANPLVTNDSCDEFPFAATYQSGNMLGLTASQCSQVVPQWNSTAGTWAFVPYPGYLPTQRCGIGHVTLSDNSSTGGMYGNFILNNRVIDQDQFYLGIGG